MAKRKPAAPAETIVWRGPEQLRPLLFPIADLFPDLANVNEHPERSIADIAASYDRFGQQKPVVAADCVVRAGNGQLEAAKRLGWTHLAVVESDLDETEVTLFALADNQTPRASGFNQARLADVLRKANEAGTRVDDLGWSPDELKPLLERARFVPARSTDPDTGDPDSDPDPSPVGPEGLGSVSTTTLPDLPGPGQHHQITISYTLDDEDAIRAFVGQEHDGPLAPNVGRQILGRIKSIAAAGADREGGRLPGA